jgi:hypothetical protein
MEEAMNAHVPAPLRSLPDIVAEYDEKRANLTAALAAFERSADALKMAATVAGTHGQENIDVRGPYFSNLESHLLKSAWLHVYDGLNMKTLSSPTDKRLWEQAMAKPPAFTLDNIRATFGKYILDPRGNILRGLAEVFCGLDQAYKSHDKVKIGVAGLPKRVVMRGFGDFSYHGRDQVQTILNSLAAYQGRPLVTYPELDALMADENALLETKVIEKPQKYGKPDLIPVIARGVRLRRFQNGNGHLFFEPDTLKDINKALAEFYGEVLPDTTDEKPTKKQASTAVSKDLQFYGTPAKLAADVVGELYQIKGAQVLEPSCGDGALMDALRKAGAKVQGIEVDPGRAAHAYAKGHAVLRANFLDTAPTPDFDHVVMNPPFYGRHYAKHVRHAFKFLKPGGTLTAILPATARYDHGELDDILPTKTGWSNSPWRDLPVGSFSESGTNINTSVLIIVRGDK